MKKLYSDRRLTMSPLDLRKTIQTQLDQIPETQLPQIHRYLITLTQPAKPTTGASLLLALPTIGTWQGDDMEYCLQ